MTEIKKDAGVLVNVDCRAPVTIADNLSKSITRVQIMLEKA